MAVLLYCSKGENTMEILLNELITINEQEFNEWTFCLNNANEEGIYSLMKPYKTNRAYFLEKRS